MGVDVEIYMNNFLKFFRENPNDLMNLIPKEREEEFYRKIRETAIKNYEKGEEISLTQSQLIKICVEINKSDKETSTKNLFVTTKFGIFCLN